jgi:hypothetical protein
MPEEAQDYKRSLFLNALATLLVALLAGALKEAQGLPIGQPLHRFLPLGAVLYGAVVALGLVAWRQIQLSRGTGPWSRALSAGVAWSVLNVLLGLYGAVCVLRAVALGL